MELSDPQLWKRGHDPLGLVLDWLIYETADRRSEVVKEFKTAQEVAGCKAVLDRINFHMSSRLTKAMVEYDPIGLGKLPQKHVTVNGQSKRVFAFMNDFDRISDNSTRAETLSATELFHMYGALSDTRRTESGDIMVYEPSTELSEQTRRIEPKHEFARFGIPFNGLEGRWLYAYVYGIPVSARHRFTGREASLSEVIYTVPLSDGSAPATLVKTSYDHEEYGVAAPKRLRNSFGPNNRRLSLRKVFEPIKEHIGEHFGILSRPGPPHSGPTGTTLHLERLRDIWTQRFILGRHEFVEDSRELATNVAKINERQEFYEAHQTLLF